MTKRTRTPNLYLIPRKPAPKAKEHLASIVQETRTETRGGREYTVSVIVPVPRPVESQKVRPRKSRGKESHPATSAEIITKDRIR